MGQLTDVTMEEAELHGNKGKLSKRRHLVRNGQPVGWSSEKAAALPSSGPMCHQGAALPPQRSNRDIWEQVKGSRGYVCRLRDATGRIGRPIVRSRPTSSRT